MWGEVAGRLGGRRADLRSPDRVQIVARDPVDLRGLGRGMDRQTRGSF